MRELSGGMQEPVDAFNHPVYISGTYRVALADPGIGNLIGPVGEEHRGLDGPVILLNRILFNRQVKPQPLFMFIDHPVQLRPICIPDIKAGHIWSAADKLEETDIRIIRSLFKGSDDEGSTPRIDIEAGD